MHMASDYLPTGFAALNALLGGKGLLQGSTVLIRGRAGTGKTTLALQIAQYALHHHDHAFVYASIEDQPATLLNFITRSFWGQDYAEYLKQSCADRWNVQDLTDYFDKKFKQETLLGILNDLADQYGLGADDRRKLDQAAKDIERLVASKMGPSRLKAELSTRLRSIEVDQVLAGLWQALLIPPNVPVILVVDSLNALINSASARFQEMSDRQMMLAVMRSFKTWRQQRGRAITVIFLVEDDSRVLNTAASYIADAIISLRQESIEQGIRETPRIARKWSQELRFCRVEKGRGLPIQSRSCCYEFVSRDEDPEDGDRGIKFLPTYGVPGIVSLFYENRPMREVIKTLRENDVPSLYPQVLVQQFSRSSLQRVFSLRRRTSGISRRHPLMLSNVDEHWLNELKKANLLQPIAISKLSMFSLPLEESAEAKDHTCFIRELTDCKQRVFGGDEQGERCCFGVPQIANVGIFVYRADVLKELGEQPPDTWEGVERICRRLGAMQKPNKLLLELQSYDTFLATALEIGWGHGAFWRTRQMDEGLRIEFDHASSPANLIAALTRLKYWIHGIEIVPLQSSVDPDLYDRDDWVFARHWYSTWVDVRTRSKQTGKQYGVIEIPLAEKHKTHCGPGAKHHSAWGVWYLAIQRGSENVELGIDLINNLMTARKITERARSGAALPTVEKFFELTDETCPHTNLTFRQIRERFFKDAKSRTEFENYPTFSRIFSGVLWTIASNPSINVIEATREAFLNIDPHYSWPDTRNLYGQLKALLSPEMLRWLEGGPVNQAAGE